ncbi:uncharacterized protein C8R40DRAFT_19096 [Lentinula edodes]|uniref:uncharacterized protein n=1 Tax=Lentinula edodes TaxID=5353 RepID=UPI001E8E4F20|nr:uncharacterized protein C8R40DRAFT_19096 [Lentinula edodes]KAH7881133.1 hypothetical protein C8R40DRAFT_19096 [Lentinula edodes]
MNCCISNLTRPINFQPRIKWSTSQEKDINQEYPFIDLHKETPNQFVVRNYLQFLWLPESLMPLDLLVTSLRRVQVASTSTDSLSTPHPLHALLDPLLLTARTAANKYQTELPQILDNNGGAGEIEETMMWYALNFERAHGEGQHERERTRTNTGSSCSTQSAESPIWMDEKWRAKWIRRMERREVQIQILLHLLILSLPGPPPPPPEFTEMSSVKRRKRPRKKATPVITPADRLEAFMDKLSMWQLMGDLDSNERERVAVDPKDELDWTQRFCQSIVEPLLTLPNFCDLLRSKVFPNSPFSDDEDEQQEQIHGSQQTSTESASPSPEPPLKRNRTATLDGASDPQARYPSPALSTTSTSFVREPKRASSHQRSRQRPALQRDRSRSLSVSLAEEAEERQKAKTTGSGANKGRVLSREVSMSFKSKSKAPEIKHIAAAPSFLESDTRRREPETRSIKREPSMNDAATILVEATPMKPIRTVSLSQTRTQGPSLATTLFPRMPSMLSSVNEEEIWNPPGSSSPDVLSLTPTKDAGSTGSTEEHFMDGMERDWPTSTPTRAGRRREYG